MQSLSRAREQLFPGGATTGSSRPVALAGRDQAVFYVIGSGTISAGTLIFEEADYAPNGLIYAGTWSAIASASVTLTSVSGGAQAAVHLVNGAYAFVRARFTVNVTGAGGLVDVVAIIQ